MFDYQDDPVADKGFVLLPAQLPKPEYLKADKPKVITCVSLEEDRVLHGRNIVSELKFNVEIIPDEPWKNSSLIRQLIDNFSPQNAELERPYESGEVAIFGSTPGELAVGGVKLFSRDSHFSVRNIRNFAACLGEYMTGCALDQIFAIQEFLLHDSKKRDDAPVTTEVKLIGK